MIITLLLDSRSRYHEKSQENALMITCVHMALNKVFSMHTGQLLNCNPRWIKILQYFPQHQFKPNHEDPPKFAKKHAM